jgi:SAM-dependent methyltransferase
MTTPANTFSETWYSVFADSIPAHRTEMEIAFLRRHLPRPAYARILDICCGRGRHAIDLARTGYDVLAIDNNPHAIARAQADAPADAVFQILDMRRLDDLDGTFDAAINMWQSFGYFDDDVNARVLRSLADRLRPSGRFVIDLYNGDAARRLPPHEEGMRGDTRVRTRREWSGARLRVELSYGDRPPADVNEWRIYTVEEWRQVAAAAGFDVLVQCAWFDEALAPAPEHLRMQFVLEKKA